jgi:hypothetical protein
MASAPATAMAADMDKRVLRFRMFSLPSLE